MTDFNGPRDVPALWGLAKTAPYFWDGSIGTLERGDPAAGQGPHEATS